MFYIELTAEQRDLALEKCDAVRTKPPLPPKPKLKSEVEKSDSFTAESQPENENGSTELRNDLNEGTGDDELPRNVYPCICEHLNIEVTVPTPSECRKFFLKKSLEDTDLLMRYQDTGRDSGNSSVASSSSSSLSYAPFANPRPTASSTTSPQQQPTALCTALELPMQDAPVEYSHVRKPLVGETRVNTLERNRIQAIEDEHKYETLDHGARPPQVSEDEGVCCPSIKSKISKKAKELVRPYQKGDHPRDRPPIPAKPPRPSLQKASRPNSNEGISDQESNYKENLDLVDQIKAAAQTAGYEPIDTSRSVIPPIPGVPTKGRLTKKDPPARQSVALEDMEQGTEFKPVLASQTSIELKGVAKKKLNADIETPKLQIDVEVTKVKKKGYENVKAVKGSLVAEASKTEEKKKGLMKRVKGIKVENPFRRTESEDDVGDPSDKPRSALKNIFKKKETDDFDDDLEEPEKRTFSTKISKVFQRDKKDGGELDDPDAPPEERKKISERLGKIFKNEPRETKQDEDSVDCDDSKKPSLMSKFFSRDTNEKEYDEGEKKTFMSKMFQRDPKDAADDYDDGNDKKPSLMSRVFSRDARDDDLDDGQERKTFSEKISEIKGKVFSRKDKNEDEVENEAKDPSEKKSLFEKYFPAEKPMIQQFVLTEEMEPDLKKRRMGKITSFQQTKEVEGDIDSPAKKLLKENIEKIATKVKEVQDMMPKTFISTRERDPELDKPDYEITTQVTVRRTPSPCRFEGRQKTVSESSNLCDREDLQITPVPAEGGDKITTDKSTVFYAKIGDSEIEVKEDHYGRIQVGDKKDPIYARPFKMLKRSLTDLSKSTPSLSTRHEEPIEFIDATEVPQEAKGEPVSHHYEQLGEPGKKKKSVSKFKVRGGHGSPKVIKVETELVKGKSLSSLNEPATISVVKTVEKQKPPVPPRPRTITPTIIGKPPSSPTTPTPSIAESCSTAPFPQMGCTPEEGVSPPSTRATTPLSMLGEWTRKKIAPPRPPPPKISTVTTKVTPTEIKTKTVSSESKPQTTTFKKPLKPCRPPPPKVSVTKTIQKTPVNADKYSVYCQTDVGLSTDLLAKIERVVSSTYDESPYKPPRSRSTSKSVDNVGAASTSSCGPRPYDAVFYDEPVRLRKAGHGQETELSKRISTLQIVEEEEPPPLPPRGIRRCKSESDIDSSDSVYYDCLGPDDMRFVSWAKEDDVRFYDRITDESQSNSVSQSTPPPSASPSETNLQELVQPQLVKLTVVKDQSLDSDSDWSDHPVQKPSPSILLKKKPLSARARKDFGGSSTDTDNQMLPQTAQPRKRHFKRSPVHSTVDPKVPEGFKRHQASDSGEDTDDLLKRAQEVQDQLRQLLSYRTEQLRVCLEADMSSSTDPEPEQVPQQSLPGDDVHGDVVSSDSEEEKELTPPPLDPREKALRHAANVAREMASSEAAFVDALKLIVEDFKGAINAGREERGDILIPNEVLDPILLYLPELLKFSSDLLENLNARVARYDEDKVIADVFVKIGQFLKLYAHYIKDYEARCNYLEDARKKYPEFNQIVQQFEASPRCNKLSVIQYMLKPVQRIPQYRLLLDDYLKHLPEDHPDRTNAQQGLHIVSAVADHADETMKQGESHAEMVRLQNSLMSTRFNVFKPGRMLIKKGNLLKHNRKTPQWRHVVLFSDCLTYMTQVQSSLNTLKLNRELPFDRLTVKADESYPNEFSVLTQSKSFTLIAQNTEERQEWIDAIRQAVDVYHQKRLTFALNSEKGDEKEDSEVIAPVWTPDSRVTMCQICRVSFTAFRRRHHCRNCGIVVCGVCSKREAWLTFNGGAYERVCDTCAVKLPRERLKSTAGLPDITPGSPEGNKGNILFELGSNDNGCTMSGYLKMYKRGSWKRYWYVLKERVLYVYKASKDVAPVDQMVVLGFEVIDIDDAKKNDQLDLCFKLRHQGLDDMVLCAEDANTAAEWKQKIRSATQI